MRSLSLRRGSRPGRPDPAPSRWSWRLQRLLLTPAFLVLLRVVMPLAAICVTAGWYFSDADRRQDIVDTVAEARESFESRPEFIVHLLAVKGVEDALDAQIRQSLAVNLPTSSFDLDLDALRAQVAALDPVKTVGVRIRPGGVLEITVRPRVPATVWRSRSGLVLLDAEGARVGPIASRMMRSDLPLIVGRGADRHTYEALALIEAAAPLEPRLRGLVRIGERRWDVVLDRGQRILLPETGAVDALGRVMALHSAQALLDRDAVRIDLRLGTRPTVQMSEFATQARWARNEGMRQ